MYEALQQQHFYKTMENNKRGDYHTDVITLLTSPVDVLRGQNGFDLQCTSPFPTGVPSCQTDQRPPTFPEVTNLRRCFERLDQ